ncbi:thioesterase family protein [Novosphingobium sp. Fuku2-ISO-50]|uniref:acyl-CoA thioesterase n=1 Tax=Novosphingobium sp. Fuku2-ISO-50 TaxID=1739114 RepID=UPI00076DE96C|nr:thioesterase family protein [Novosphingobium sp. Fuku2-ISO-50]KUR73261.1 thioesterase [Novosphingobium sp. Fuku2-ISO-50]
MADLRNIASYPVVIEEKVRLSDTDRQGHVNNVSFSFFLEAGRAAIVLADETLLEPDCFFVIVTTSIDFLGELNYPGVITVANGIERIGSSSLTVRQALFQHGKCASLSVSTMAQVNILQKRAQPLSDRCRAYFAERMLTDVS